MLFGLSSGAVLGLEPVLVYVVTRSSSSSTSSSGENGHGHFGQYFGTLYTLISMASISGIPFGSNLVNACRGMYWGLVIFVGVSFGVGMLGLLLVRGGLLVVSNGREDGDTVKGKGKSVVRAVEWKKLMTARGWRVERI